MRRAGNGDDAIGCGHARHFQRHVQVNRAIVDGRQQMAMQVEHLTPPEQSAGVYLQSGAAP
ncbi:hypothetical protein D3C85_1869000 [compost metagenome]